MKRLKTDNRGLSLVELIVAISIGVIVAGSIAALMTFAIRTYRNESVNTEMQYEIQTNINMIMDEIMGSSVFVIEQNNGVDPLDTDKGPYTKYALFGNPNADITVGGSPAKGFKGVIFVSSAADADGKFNIFMDRIEEQIAAGTPLSTYAGTKAAAVTGTEYLLGENATQFVIQADPNSRFDDTKMTYTNPIEIGISLQFEKDGWGREYSKHVNDTVYMRNKATETVYVKKPGDTSFVEFNLKKKED